MHLSPASIGGQRRIGPFNAECPGKTGIGVGFLPTAGLKGPPRFIGAFAVQVRGMDEAFSTANLLQWLSPCCYPTDTAEEIMRILSRREGFSATTIMRQQLLAA